MCCERFFHRKDYYKNAIRSSNAVSRQNFNEIIQFTNANAILELLFVLTNANMYHPVFGGFTWLLKITRLISNRPMQHNCYVGSHNRQAQALLKPAGKSRRHKLDRSIAITCNSTSIASAERRAETRVRLISMCRILV